MEKYICIALLPKQSSKQSLEVGTERWRARQDEVTWTIPKMV